MKGKATPVTMGNQSYETNISLGRIIGKDVITKFGRASIGATESIISHLGIYGMPDDADNIVINSDSLDDVVAGDGARLIRVFGINENDSFETEDLVVGIDSVKLFKRVYKLRVIESGTVSPTGDGGNLGTLTVTQSNDLVDMLSVPPNEGSSLCACFTVPKGYTALMHYADTTVGEGKDSVNRFKVRDYTNPLTPFTVEGIRDNFENQVGRTFDFPSEIGEMTDIVFTGISSASGTNVSCVFVLELIENKTMGY